MTARAIRHEAISASAGSGKTFQLAHRFIRLTADGVPPDRITALTFSRKAAAEIFESVVEHLCRASGGEADAAVTAGRIGRPGRKAADFLALLRGFLDSLHRLHIGTLDSFIIGILRAFPAEVGVPADFQVADDNGPPAAAVRQEVLDRLFRPDALDRRARSEFLEAFQEATFGREEKGIETNLIRFLDAYRRPYRILPDPAAWGAAARIWPGGSADRRKLPDAARTAQELRERFAVRELPAQMRSGLERVITLAASYEADSRWDAGLDANKVFRELMARRDELRRAPLKISYHRREYALTAPECRGLAALLDRLVRTELQGAVRRTAGLFRVLQRYEALYDPIMRQTGRLSFTDAQHLLTAANEYSGGAVLSRSAGAGRLYIDYRLDARLDHWLLDEFQDTSDLQWAVLRNLVSEILQDDSGRRSFFYVGDVKQAIYRWRGGNPRLFGQILADYGPAIRRRTLSTSYRSCPAVIEAVNAVFSTLPDALPPGTRSEWERIWERHESARDLAGIEGCAALLEVVAPRGAQKPGAEERRAAVAELLRDIEPLARGLSAAVLVRSNEEGKETVDFLRRACPGMPVVHEGKARIREHPAAELLLSLVKFAAHPGDTFAWRHLQMSPLNRRLSQKGQGRDRLPVLLLREMQEDGFQSFLRLWTRRLNAACPLDAHTRIRLAELAGAAGEFDRTGSADADAFLRFIDAYEGQQPAGHGAVRVMTIHQAKGLGFDVVILPELTGRDMTRADRLDLVFGRDPATHLPAWALKMPRRIVAESDPVLRAETEAADADACFDELCVLYVAMTRARRGLYLITSDPGPHARAFTPAVLLKTRLADETGARGDPPTPEVKAEVLYQSGAPDWYRRVPRAARPPAAPPPAPGLPAPEPTTGARLIYVQPSAQEQTVRRAAWLFAAESRDVLDFGRAVHELFEQVEWAETTDAEAVIGKWLETAAAGEEVKRDACRQFRDALAAGEVARALARPDGEVELWREKPFEIVLGNRFVTGTFDRVTIVRRPGDEIAAVDVLDYKSDRIGRAREFQQAVEAYRPQLALYGEALSRILHVEPARITRRLLFTRAGRVFPV